MTRGVAEFLNNTSGYRILVIGDSMLDRYIYGSVNRISPEAPVLVLLQREERASPGGAANVACNLRGLASEVWLLSIVGNDRDGKLLVTLLEKEGINTRLTLSSQDRMTISKIRVMAESQHLLRVDREKIESLEDEIEMGIIKSLHELLENVKMDMVIFQDYNKGLLNRSFIARLLTLFSGKGIPVAVDPKFQNFLEYKGVTIFKPNFSELRACVPFHVEVNQKSLEKAAKFLLSELECRLVLFTLSENGAFISDGTESFLVPAHKGLIADVCGAGDTVISVAALAWLAGFDLESIAWWSVKCGTLVCQYPGVMPISRDWIK